MPLPITPIVPPAATLPETAPVRMPTELSPFTLIVPVLVTEPVRAESTAMPAELRPSTVIVPVLETVPVTVPPGATRMP